MSDATMDEQEIDEVKDAIRRVALEAGYHCSFNKQWSSIDHFNEYVWIYRKEDLRGHSMGNVRKVANMSAKQLRSLIEVKFAEEQQLRQ